MKADLKKIKAWLKLLTAPEIGHATAIKLAKILGEPVTFLDDSTKLLDLEFISEAAKEHLANIAEPENWENICELIEQYNIKFVSILDDDYPGPLKNIFDPPPFLFYRGIIKKDDFRRAIGVVGTRKASNYGKLMTKKIVQELAASGFMIVSGLAYGIDTISHLAALDRRAITYAVMGTGVDQIYPSRNRELAERILENGVLISEFVPGSKAEKWNFPIRNRIISGLSLGCLIIEGNKKSGALLTAKFAMDQNRDVFALPGDVNRPQAEGPNYLIKLGAKIITKAADILEEYELTMVHQPSFFPELNEKEELVYQFLLNNKPETHFDKLIVKTGFTVGELSTVLLSLELKNVIKKVPGNKVVPLY
ncbi:MAG: DNA-processing protein DprA [Candidatus Tenebribacter davisii]|nr:DNA-processing protein DprA [Candidatus Tenebribacter davisii]